MMAETFGKTDIGGISRNWTTAVTNSYIISLECQSGAAGELASISVYFSNLDEGRAAKCAIYDSSFNLLTNGETEKKTAPAGGWSREWITFDFPISPEVAASTTYYLAVWFQGSDGNPASMYWDTIHDALYW
ncbi:unnamed protein product, partial [marine sediment metagenome]